MNDPVARIQPRLLKGFRDFLPVTQIPREQVIDTARGVFRSFGFAPIDTPALEYAEILTGKGSDETDKQMYRFEDHGGRDVALRFDLTVPLARFVAQHEHDLGMPFKRYHIGPVWRGEKNQAGRYREFFQCDFDTVGTTSIQSDIETILVMSDLFDAIGVPDITIRVNNRRVLNGLLEDLGAPELTTPVLRAIDKLDKIGADAVGKELAEAGLAAAGVDRVLAFASVEGEDDAAILDTLSDTVGSSEQGATGIAQLAEVLTTAERVGLPQGRVRLDLAIARGLDYYTGTVFETRLNELPTIGSVCSGGRYDDLASRYTKTHLPGVGASLGLDRLLAALEQLERLDTTASTADLFLPFFSAERGADYQALAARLRNAGHSVELYPEPRKLGAQLKYADRRGHKLAIIIGDDEWEANTAQVKDLTTGNAKVIPQADLPTHLTN